MLMQTHLYEGKKWMWWLDVWTSNKMLNSYRKITHRFLTMINVIVGLDVAPKCLQTLLMTSMHRYVRVITTKYGMG